MKNLIPTLLKSYLYIQYNASKSVKNGIATNELRATLRNQISEQLGIEHEIVQLTIEKMAMEIKSDLSISEILNLNSDELMERFMEYFKKEMYTSM